jgi:YfiH family protein
LGLAEVRWTSRAHGHLGLAPEAATNEERALAARRSAVVDLPWSWLRQVHGSSVRVVEAAGGSRDVEGDALVTRSADAVLAVFTADCAPVAFASPDGVVGVAHAGWRGLAHGVIARTADAMRALGATSLSAALGPCIKAPCYEFGAQDLDRVARQLGDRVRSTTSWGTPALDLSAAVVSALASAGVDLVADAGACTSCSTTWFSQRARGERDRQATLVWVPR